MRILTRYLLRLHLAPFVFSLTALTVLLLLDQVAKKFDLLIGKGLPWHVIAQVFVLSIPFILAMTLPMAVLMAVLYTFNQLAAENEISAMRASGISLPRILLPLVGVAALLATGMVWFNNTVLPESNHRLQNLLTEIAQKKPTFALDRERAIIEVLPSQLFLQANHIDRANSSLREVTVYDERDPRRSRTIYADSGHVAFDRYRTTLRLTLYNGVLGETRTDAPESFQQTRFRQLDMRVPGVSNRLQRDDTDFRGDREMSIGQMKKQVASSRQQLDAVAEESALLALGLTRKALGLPPFPAAAGRDTTSTARSTAARDTSASARNLAAASAASGAAPVAARDSSPAARGRSAASTITSAREVSIRYASLAAQSKSAQEVISRFEVEIQKKFSIPFICIVFVIVGAPIAIRFPRGGVSLVVVVSLAFFCAYYVGLIQGEDLADRLILTPFWAMWAPNVLFGTLGLLAVWRSVRAP